MTSTSTSGPVTVLHRRGLPASLRRTDLRPERTPSLRPVALVRSRATWAGLAVLAVAGLMIFLVRREPGTDDAAFVEYTGRFGSIQDWVAFRYESWSGRLLPEALIYAL